jgi:hypothetical protein
MGAHFRAADTLGSFAGGRSAAPVPLAPVAVSGHPWLAAPSIGYSSRRKPIFSPTW